MQPEKERIDLLPDVLLHFKREFGEHGGMVLHDQPEAVYIFIDERKPGGEEDPFFPCFPCELISAGVKGKVAMIPDHTIDKPAGKLVALEKTDEVFQDGRVPVPDGFGQGTPQHGIGMIEDQNILRTAGLDG
jgi:hypothetical protein